LKYQIIQKKTPTTSKCHKTFINLSQTACKLAASSTKKESACEKFQRLRLICHPSPYLGGYFTDPYRHTASKFGQMRQVLGQWGAAALKFRGRSIKTK
jgi:hypothetical protein